MHLINNETSRNNTRGFNKWWEAGGAKFAGDGGLQDSMVDGHRAFSNHGDGIWYDWKNRNNTLQNGNFSYNQGFGIQYEASRSEEHTSELQSLMRISYAVFCLKKKTHIHTNKVVNMNMISSETATDSNSD